MRLLSGDIDTVLTPMWRVLNTHIDRLQHSTQDIVSHQH